MISKKDRLEITSSWLLNSSEYKEYKKCYEDLKLFIENAVDSNLTKEQRSAWNKVRSSTDLEDLAKTQESYLDFEFLSGISKKSGGDLTTIFVNCRRDKILDTQVEVFIDNIDFDNGSIRLKEGLPFMFSPYVIDFNKIETSYPDFYKGLCEKAGNFVESLKNINGKLEKVFDLLTCNTTLELVSKNLKPSSNVSELESLLSKEDKNAELLCMYINREDAYDLENYYESLFQDNFNKFLKDARKSHLGKICSEIKKLWNEYIVDTCPVLGELFKVSPNLCKTITYIGYYPGQIQILGSKFDKYLEEQLEKPISRIAALGYISIGVHYGAEEGPIIKDTLKTTTNEEFIDWLWKNKTTSDLKNLRELTLDYYKDYQKMLDSLVLFLDRDSECITLRDKKGAVQEIRTYKELLDIDKDAFDLVCENNNWVIDTNTKFIVRQKTDKDRRKLITKCIEKVNDWIS